MSNYFKFVLLGIGILVSILLFVLLSKNKSESATQKNGTAAPLAPSQNKQPVFSATKIVRPLAISQKTNQHEWTEGDAMSEEVIQKISHNPDEFLRLMQENDRIIARQLVYRKETVPQLLERMRQSNQEPKELILPGLHGQEVTVEIQNINAESSLKSGTITGKVKGHLNSMVSLGFFDGCESFNIIDPEANLYLTADAREPGEVLVKHIDPIKYAPPTPCEPIINQPLKPNNIPSK